MRFLSHPTWTIRPQLWELVSIRARLGWTGHWNIWVITANPRLLNQQKPHHIWWFNASPNGLTYICEMMTFFFHYFEWHELGREINLIGWPFGRFWVRICVVMSEPGNFAKQNYMPLSSTENGKPADNSGNNITTSIQPWFGTTWAPIKLRSTSDQLGAIGGSPLHLDKTWNNFALYRRCGNMPPELDKAPEFTRPLWVRRYEKKVERRSLGYK